MEICVLTARVLDFVVAHGCAPVHAYTMHPSECLFETGVKVQALPVQLVRECLHIAVLSILHSNPSQETCDLGPFHSSLGISCFRVKDTKRNSDINIPDISIMMILLNFLV